MSNKQNKNTSGGIPLKRGYSWSIVVYDNLIEICDQIDKLYDTAKISHYAYILHNKDIYLEDGKNDVLEFKKGDLRAEHLHIVLVFKQNVSLNQIRELLNIQKDKNIFGEIVKDKNGLADYFFHKNTPQKYQYEESSIISNDFNYFKQKTTNKEHKDIKDLIEDMTIYNLTYRELAYKYGRDFIINFRAYKTYVFLIEQEEKEQERKLIEEQLTDKLRKELF